MNVDGFLIEVKDLEGYIVGLMSARAACRRLRPRLGGTAKAAMAARRAHEDRPSLGEPGVEVCWRPVTGQVGRGRCTRRIVTDDASR
jgi:hypothetical protein